LEQIRIVLADLPRLLQDIVMQAVAEQPDMIVVDVSCPPADLRAVMHDQSIDLAILALNGAAEFSRVDDALYASPRLKIIGITRDGRDSYLRELVPHTLALGNLEPSQLADAIRRITRAESAGC
jgi:DNA-binding NarL/FixJ family response regulator